MTRALSLDFWGTLAVPNPAYSAARTAYLSRLANLSTAEANHRYRAVKRRLDGEAERHGTAVTPTAACARLAEALGVPLAAGELRGQLESLTRASPPVVTPRTLDELRQAADAGLVLCLASNTNFLGGALMTELFPDLPLHGRVYSDQVGTSKPHADFFGAVLGVIRRHALGLEPAEVTHVGDHPVCDRDGAERTGFAAVLVRSPADTDDALREIVASLRRGR